METKDYIDEKNLNTPKIRLIHTKIFRTGEKKVSDSFSLSGTFKIPDSITLEEACKIVSYVTEQIEQQDEPKRRSENKVTEISKILNNLGFEYDGRRGQERFALHFNQPAEKRKIDIAALEPEEGVVDLITNYGDLEELKLTNLGDRYTNWFTPNVTKEEIQQLYNKIKESQTIEDEPSM